MDKVNFCVDIEMCEDFLGVIAEILEVVKIIQISTKTGVARCEAIDDSNST